MEPAPSSRPPGVAEVIVPAARIQAGVAELAGEISRSSPGGEITVALPQPREGAS